MRCRDSDLGESLRTKLRHDIARCAPVSFNDSAYSHKGVATSSCDGQRIDAATRVLLDALFHHNFAHVRVHDDAEAARSAAALDADAYTVGSHIVFGAGQYRPHTEDGQRLLAHELTHVVQQSQAASAPRGPLRVGSKDDAFERQAEHAAAAATQGRPVSLDTLAAPVMIQRQARGGSSRRPRTAPRPPAGVLTAVELLSPNLVLAPAQLRGLSQTPLPSRLRVNGSPVPTQGPAERPRVGAEERERRYRPPHLNVEPNIEGRAPVRTVGIEFSLENFQISRFRNSAFQMTFLREPSMELRLTLPGSEQAPQRVQHEARAALALLQMQWDRDGREYARLVLGRIEGTAQQGAAGAPQPSGELSAGVSGTYRPSPAVSLTAGASALMQSGERAPYDRV